MAAFEQGFLAITMAISHLKFLFAVFYSLYMCEYVFREYTIYNFNIWIHGVYVISDAPMCEHVN